MPTILTIAGSDPTGGAGVQADLQVICSLRCHGAGVITSITIQDTERVRAAHHLPADWVREQLECLLADVGVAAIKTGMLGTGETVEAVADVLRRRTGMPLVVDPVLRSTSGLPLLEEGGVEVLRRALLPQAALVTPNLAEAGALTGMEVSSVEEMRECVRALTGLGARAALIKGGHLPGEPIDVLCVGESLYELRGRRVGAGREVHGTGCALSAAAAAFLGRGCPVLGATEQAKAYVAAGIEAAHTIGRGAAVMDYMAAARAVLA
jgi:hydroxymethylpyrimidine/phosphomethylpyrimidine kinase